MTEGQTNDTTQAEPANSAMFRKPAILWGAIGLVVVIAAGGGAYLIWGKQLSGPSGPSVCETMVARARDYGVVPPNTTLKTPDAAKNEGDGRPLCSAQSGATHYSMTADLTCSDMSKKTCLTLYSVRQDDGTSLFQKQM